MSVQSNLYLYKGYFKFVPDNFSYRAFPSFSSSCALATRPRSLTYTTPLVTHVPTLRLSPFFPPRAQPCLVVLESKFTIYLWLSSQNELCLTSFFVFPVFFCFASLFLRTRLLSSGTIATLYAPSRPCLAPMGPNRVSRMHKLLLPARAT